MKNEFCEIFVTDRQQLIFSQDHLLKPNYQDQLGPVTNLRKVLYFLKALFIKKSFFIYLVAANLLTQQRNVFFREKRNFEI